jgi:hypothetical protein
MTTHAILKADIQDWLLESDLSTVIPSFVRLAETSIRRDVRVRAMETSATLTIVDGVAPLPANFIQARRLILDNGLSWALDYVPPDVLYSAKMNNESGSAIAYTIEGCNVVFRPKASESAKMLYLAAFAPLSGEQDTNWLLTNAYDVYLYGALRHTAPYLKEDPRVATWNSAYQEAVASLNKQETYSRISGSALRVLGAVGP